MVIDREECRRQRRIGCERIGFSAFRMSPIPGQRLFALPKQPGGGAQFWSFCYAVGIAQLSPGSASPSARRKDERHPGLPGNGTSGRHWPMARHSSITTDPWFMGGAVAGDVFGHGVSWASATLRCPGLPTRGGARPFRKRKESGLPRAKLYNAFGVQSSGSKGPAL